MARNLLLVKNVNVFTNGNTESLEEEGKTTRNLQEQDGQKTSQEPDSKTEINSYQDDEKIKSLEKKQNS